MNAKPIFAALAFAAMGSAAFAIEATQGIDPVSTLTREEVKAELARAQHDGTLMSSGEPTMFVDRPVPASQRSREDVRAEAVAAAHEPSGTMPYIGG